MIPLSERINLELRHRNPAEVTELNLDTSKADKIEGLTDEYVNLRELSLVNVGLKSLLGFPNLPNLEKLDLSDNRISGDLDCLKYCPKLTQLFLTSNRFRNIDQLRPLSDLKALEVVDLCNCDVTEIENYRTSVFQLLPQLQYLDGYDRNEVDDSESDDYEEDDSYYHNDDFETTNAKFGYTSGKNGLMSSIINYHNDVGEYSDDEIHTYDDARSLFDTYNVYNEVDEEETESDDSSDPNCPPNQGSKYVPLINNKSKISHRCAPKRSYSSDDDEYESAAKIFIEDGIGFIPSHD